MVVSMERWTSKVAIVTGASSGIGAAIAEKLVKNGLQVVGLARRSERIEENTKKLGGERGKLYAVKTDMTKEEGIVRAFKWTKENVGPVAILINSAGVIKQTNLIEGDTEMWKKTLDTNVLGLSIATREAVKAMRDNNIEGHIVHINSIMGHSVPNYSNINVYAASQFAITALTETLRQELNSIGSKIKITSVSPGTVRTEMGQNNNFKFDEETKVMMEKSPMLKPEDCADAVLYVLSTPPHVQVQELTIKPVGEAF